MFALKVDQNGFVRTKAQKDPVPDGWEQVDQSTYDKVGTANPTQEQKAWHWNSGDPELRETGVSISPEPGEAKRALLAQAENQWGYSLARIQALRNQYSLLFDFIEGENYGRAKEVLRKMYNDGVLRGPEMEWAEDMFDGKVDISSLTQ